MTRTVLDFHTHRLPDDPGTAVVSVAPQDFAPQPGHLYAVGVHPWHSGDADVAAQLALLPSLAAHPQVVAIGETGLDPLRGAPLERQMTIMREHIAIAEAAGLPLVVHMVRTSQQVLQLWRQSARRVPWVIHGMRGNANVARPLLAAGFYLSYGARFNPAALLITPSDHLLLETDDAPVTIHTVAQSVAQALGQTPEAIERLASLNASRVLSGMGSEGS